MHIKMIKKKTHGIKSHDHLREMRGGLKQHPQTIIETEWAAPPKATAFEDLHRKQLYIKELGKRKDSDQLFSLIPHQ